MPCGWFGVGTLNRSFAALVPCRWEHSCAFFVNLIADPCMNYDRRFSARVFPYFLLFLPFYFWWDLRTSSLFFQHVLSTSNPVFFRSIVSMGTTCLFFFFPLLYAFSCTVLLNFCNCNYHKTEPFGRIFEFTTIFFRIRCWCSLARRFISRSSQVFWLLNL